MRFNLADGMKVTLVIYVGIVYTIKLDCHKKRVYWLEYSNSIKSLDYGGKQKKTITKGPFHSRLLDVMGDSLYFLNTNEYRINVMNISNGKISRKIPIDNANYQDLLLVDESVQPACKLYRITESVSVKNCVIHACGMSFACGSCIFTLSENRATCQVHGSRYPARKTIQYLFCKITK